MWKTFRNSVVIRSLCVIAALATASSAFASDWNGWKMYPDQGRGLATTVDLGDSVNLYLSCLHPMKWTIFFEGSSDEIANLMLRHGLVEPLTLAVSNATGSKTIPSRVGVTGLGRPMIEVPFDQTPVFLEAIEGAKSGFQVDLLRRRFIFRPHGTREAILQLNGACSVPGPPEPPLSEIDTFLRDALRSPRN